MTGAARLLATDGTTLKVSATFPRLTCAALFGHFTDPALLARWWAPAARIDLRVGGTYELRWPTQGWALRGRYSEVAAPTRLAFTWRWAHEADQPERFVSLEIRPEAQTAPTTATSAPEHPGAKLHLTHGPYTLAAADQEMRAVHLAGWEHFLGRLATL